VLKVVVVLMLVNCFPVVDHAPSVTRAYAGIGGSPLEEASRHAQDLREQCAQQISGFFFPVILNPSFSPGHYRLFLFWSLLSWTILFIALFFPRRFLFIRPSADDDPPLNYASL
jgi:hypothetical protein